MLQGVRETQVREGPLEVVTLQAETNTPRRRMLSESYEHVLTPIGELPPVRRKRLKAESSARSRALLRLQPSKHAQHLQKRKRKRSDANAVVQTCGANAVVQEHNAACERASFRLDSTWQRHE